MGDYAILSKNNPRDLEKEVLKYLKFGWEYLGGVSVATAGSMGSTIYVQAMTREELEVNHE